MRATLALDLWTNLRRVLGALVVACQRDGEEPWPVVAALAVKPRDAAPAARSPQHRPQKISSQKWQRAGAARRHWRGAAGENQCTFAA